MIAAHTAMLVCCRLQGMIAPYAVVLVLILLIFLFTWKNCPSGLCMTGFVLNVLLIFFALLPIFYTIFMLLMRDTCANVEQVVLKAVEVKMGNGSMPYTVASYYLGGGKGPDGNDMNVTQLFSTVLPNLDINAMKANATGAVDIALQSVASFRLKDRVSSSAPDTATSQQKAAVLWIALALMQRTPAAVASR
jgi:hypothetical protein